MDVSSGPTLRQRQREQTRRLIHDAVLELSADVGFGNVTVEAISARAGISPRTFFNHFAGKEAAVLMDPPVRLRDPQAAQFVGGPRRPARELLVELTRLLLDQLAADPPDRRTAEAVFAIAADNPGVLAALVGQMDAVRLELAAAVEARLPSGGDRQVADLVASLAMAAMRSGLETWAAGEVAGSEDSPVPAVRRAVEIMTSLTGGAG